MSLKIHLTCESTTLEGWDSIEIGEGSKINLDSLGSSVMWKPKSADFIYLERFIHYLYREDAESLIKNCFSVLRPGGTIRITTLSLETLIQDWKTKSVSRWGKSQWYPQTPCRMLNEAFRQSNNKFIWDYQELNSTLLACGFHYSYLASWRKSPNESLRNLETRPDMLDLIVEAKIL